MSKLVPTMSPATILRSKSPESATVTRVDSIDSMIDSGLSILGEQIEKLRLMSRVATFDAQEVKNLNTLITSLINLSREERERIKTADFGDMTEEQLLEYAQKLVDEKNKKTKP